MKLTNFWIGFILIFLLCSYFLLMKYVIQSEQYERAHSNFIECILNQIDKNKSENDAIKFCKDRQDLINRLDTE